MPLDILRSAETQCAKEVSDDVLKMSPAISVTLDVGESSEFKNIWYDFVLFDDSKVSEDSEVLENSVVSVDFGLSVDSVVFVGFEFSVDSVLSKDSGICSFLNVCALVVTLILLNASALVLLHPGLY